MSERVFGHIVGNPLGSWYNSRAELSKAGVHRPTQAGIAGSQDQGADSIVLSGGYEDDRDHGSWIIYTGQGGRDPSTGAQIAHQPLNRGNMALAKSCLYGLPIRVIRGAGNGSPWAPEQGYRYDGLFRVEQYWKDRGVSGYYVWRYLLCRIGEEEGAVVSEEPTTYRLPRRIEQSTVRVVRDTKQARRLKELYAYRCQVCGIRLEGSAGPYAEAAHVKPLGRPHNGPDVNENIICLCPNHHVLFDYGGFSVATNLSLIGLRGSLIMHAHHTIDPDFLEYHQQHFLRDHI